MGGAWSRQATWCNGSARLRISNLAACRPSTAMCEIGAGCCCQAAACVMHAEAASGKGRLPLGDAGRRHGTGATTHARMQTNARCWVPYVLVHEGGGPAACPAAYASTSCRPTASRLRHWGTSWLGPPAKCSGGIVPCSCPGVQHNEWACLARGAAGGWLWSQHTGGLVRSFSLSAEWLPSDSLR